MSNPAWSLPFSRALLVCLMSPGVFFSPAPTLQWTNCIKAVSESKNIFPSLTNISEIVTDQFLCSGMPGEEHPCRGKKPAPLLPGRSSGVASTHLGY